MADMKGALGSSKNMNWITPDWVIWALERKLGRFNLDPCCTPESAKAPRILTPRDNGLVHPWFGKVFMNPPYGKHVRLWILKAISECLKGHAELVCCLLAVRTDTQWFFPCYQAHEWVFFTGRIPFIHPDPKKERPTPAFTSVAVVFRRAPKESNSPIVSNVRSKELIAEWEQLQEGG